MADSLRLVITGDKRLWSKLEARTLIGPPLQRFLKRLTHAALAEVMSGTNVDTGHTRRQWRAQVDPSPMPQWGKVTNPVFYGPYQNFGTGTQAGRSRHQPPAAALEQWARRHGIIDRRTGRGAGFIVARAIGKRGGLRPVKFLEAGWLKTKPRVQGFLSAMAREIEARWGA